MNESALISEIKGHSLDDGPGIRSVVFFKGCPLRCVWCHNPETLRALPQPQHDEHRCRQQGHCRDACPSRALSGPPWRLELSACNGCGRCVEACEPLALRLIGQDQPVAELLQRLERYRPFFRNSGGGVTLSGGEATMYPVYCGELLRALGRLGIHRLLETCGLFDYQRVARTMLPALDCIYFDLKFIDDRLHRRHCGRSNRRILSNFHQLLDWAGKDRELLPRVPLIPGLTTAPDNLLAIAEFLRQQSVTRVSLLPYNPLWHNKAQQLGQAPRYAGTNWLTASQIQQAQDCFQGFTLQ